MRAKLEFALLGPPQIKLVGQPVTGFKTIKAQALLYYLVVTGQPQVRATLANLFWGDMPEEQARVNLSKALSELHTLFHNHITIERQQIAFNRASDHWLDLHDLRITFDALMEEEPSWPAHEQLSRKLAQKVDLYRGDFLEGFYIRNAPEFEMWMLAERGRQQELIVQMLDRLVENSIAVESWQTGIDYAKRLLAIEPWREAAHRQLMVTYAALGDRSAALRQHERCIEVLERELGVAPLPETETLYQAILAGDGAATTLSYKPAWVTLPRSGVPLLGRDELLHKLAATFRLAQARQGQVVLLRGEAGIGKSRLMQEFATSVQTQAMVLASACYPSTHSIPYQPVIEALRPLLGSTSLLRTMPAAWLSDASILLPELRQLSPAVAPPLESLDPQQARGRLFEALHQIVMGLTSGSFPLLLCLDDLHWADSTTLDWLGYLARHAQRRAFMLVATFRDDEAGALADLLHELGRIGLRPELPIRGLENEFVGQLLVHLRVADASAMTERLHDVTGGNPFFLLETISELLESTLDGATVAERSELPISENVREAVQRRLERLLPLSRQVLDAGAVQETTFAFDFIRKIAGRSEMETADALDELVNRTLLVEEGDGFRFRHELIRAAVYHELSPWRGRVLHQRVAQVLEAEQAGQTEAVAVQLARHFQAGGESAKAIFYWRQAGDVATRLYAQAQAINAYRRGLEVAKTSLLHEHLPSLYSSLGHALELASHFDQALATYVEMEATAVAIGSRTMQLQALMAQATLYSIYNPQQDLARGEALSRKALELAKTVQDEAAEAKILWNLIILYSYAYRWEEAIESGQRSIEIARRINLPEQLALSINDMAGHIYEISGQFTKAKEMLEEARGLWQALGNMNMLADNLATIAAIGVWEGDYQHALDVGQQALHINQEIESLWGQSYSQYKLGWVHWERGHADLALSTMQETLHLARMSGFGVPQVVTQADAAILYAELGDFEHAIEAARLALIHAEETQAPILLPYALGALAQVQTRQGNPDQAAAMLARLHFDSGSAANSVFYAPTLVARAMLALKRQEYAQAVTDARRLGRHSVSALRPTALFIEAQALLGLGESSAAYACLVEARHAAQAIGSRRTLWRVLHWLGKTHTDRAEGERLLRQAKRLVCTIAAYIPSADLRARFPATPQLRSLLDDCKEPSVPAAK